MIINEQQMNAFKAATFKAFVRRVLAFIETDCDFSHPYDGSSVPQGDECEAVVLELLERAKSHGICTELGLVQFVIVGLAYSRTFDSIPKVREMLTRAGMLPDDGIQQVLNVVLAAEARRA